MQEKSDSRFFTSFERRNEFGVTVLGECSLRESWSGGVDAEKRKQSFRTPKFVDSLV